MNAGTESTSDDDDEDFDLLSDMSEDGGIAWVPQDDDQQPKGIQGRVTHVGTVLSDAKYGGHEVPYLEIADKDDPEHIWSVRGYATALRNQIEKANPEVGDLIGLVYFGLKENRSGDNEYHNFGVRVRKAR